MVGDVTVSVSVVERSVWVQQKNVANRFDTLQPKSFEELSRKLQVLP
jgi:hypothetical protein